MGDSKISIRISERLWNLLKDEQTSIRKMRGKEPSFAEVLDMWADACGWELRHVPDSEQKNPNKGTSGNPEVMLISGSVEVRTGEPVISIPQDFVPWVLRLLHILEKKHPKALPAIHSNLIAFEELSDMGGQHEPTPSDPDTRTTEEIIRELEAATAPENTEDSKRRNRPRRKAS
jgi:hypothetical protein